MAYKFHAELFSTFNYNRVEEHYFLFPMDIRVFVCVCVSVSCMLMGWGGACEHVYGYMWVPGDKFWYHPQEGCPPPPQSLSLA